MEKRSRTLRDLIEIAVGRYDGASGRQLADIAQRAGHDVSHTTLNRLRNGTYASRPSDATIRAIAYLAEVPETSAFVAAGVRPPGAEHYRLPDESQRMSTRQRRALDELVRAFVDQELAPTVPAMGNLLTARNELAEALDVKSRHLATAARSVLAAIDEFVEAAAVVGLSDESGGA